MLVETDAALRDFMARCAKSPYMAIDTEFLREKTYYAKLCLVQIAIEGEVAIIDPLGIRDLSVMAPALSDPNIMKIFHASSQDIEILYHETGVVPTPVFDTQVAAALLGKTQQASYASLVHTFSAEKGFVYRLVAKTAFRLAGGIRCRRCNLSA